MKPLPSDKMNTNQDAKSVLGRVEWAVAIAISVGLGLLHVSVLQNAGALWRDEINTATVAQARTLAESWNLLPFESAPYLFHFLVRIWTAIVGGGDGALRTLGLFVGIAILAALWLNARLLTRSVPLISLALFGMNAVVIRFGDSVRSYGLGVVFMLLTMALIWRVATSPNRLMIALAALSALGAVQSLYQNAFFVLAICVAGMVVTIRHRQYKRTGLILAIGGVAAVSLLPYVSIINDAQQYLALYQDEFGFTRALSGVAETLNSSGVFMAGTWGVCFILGACVVVAGQFPATFDLPPAKRDLALYCGLAVAIAVVCFCIFWKNSKLDMYPWYTMLPLGLLAVFFDTMLAVLPAVSLKRLMAICLSTSIVIGCFSTVWTSSHMPHTNIGKIVAKLESSAGTNDLIVVMPWYIGTTFHRYYKGQAQWITLPELGGYEIQREDLLKDKLAMPNASASALERVSRTLQAGNAIWLVGEPRFQVPADYVPKPLPPAPLGDRKWFASPYLHLWRDELTYLLRNHTQRGGNPIVPVPGPDITENVPLWVFEGWK